jgi:hypothetical protein
MSRVDGARTQWIRSSRCDNSGPNCVEVRRTNGTVVVRDSADPNGPILAFSPDEWRRFLDGARDGDFDLV